MKDPHKSASPLSTGSYCLPEEQRADITDIAQRHRTSRSTIVRWALEFALDRQAHWLDRRSPSRGKIAPNGEGEG